VLKQGILAAQPRAHENGELGVRLILIAARRVPEILDTLYQDDELMDALPNNVGQALRQKDVESLEILLDGPPEYFLLALSHALQTSDEQVITARMVQRLWALYMDDDKISLPSMYQAHTLLRLMGTQSSHQMTDNAIDTLLGYIIEANDNDLFVDVASHLANRDILFPRLSSILQNHHQSFEQLLTLMNWVADIDNVSSTDVMTTYFELLDVLGWDETTQPMIEAAARLLNQNTNATVSARHYARLFDASTMLKLESPARTAMNRLLSDLMVSEDSAQVVSEIVRIYKKIAWSKPLLETFNVWWRNYTHASSLVQLQRLDRELDAYRILDTQRQILQTAIAMRKLLGNRNLLEFADAVNTTYSVLESISDAFDKSQLTDVDPLTVRNELDAFSDDIPPDERHILSKNLRELAQLIVKMSDKRSKSSIMRSDEAIDRQLMYGSANPQGSIDVMKWIAGYLGGTHQKDEEE